MFSRKNFVNLGGGGAIRKMGGFTLVELLVVIAIIGVLIALLLPAIQAAREAARKSQCGNNLKQIGLAIHNFHQALEGLPPAGVGGHSSNPTGRPGFWVLIWPFVEQVQLYDIVGRHGFGQNYGTDFWLQDGNNVIGTTASAGTTVDAFRKGCSSVNVYYCPSRRGAGPHMNPVLPATEYGNAFRDSEGWGIAPGPQNDYSFVISMRNSPPTVTNWHDFWRKDEPSHYEGHAGPIRVAMHTQAGDNPNTWAPRDTFARMADGTSNQIVVGERHIPPDRLNVCSRTGEGNSEPAGDEEGQRYVRDCSYLGSGLARGYAAAQPIRRSNADSGNLAAHVNTIRRATDFEGINVSPRDIGFGSYHPGSCHFLLGDGAVKSLAVTTPSLILVSLASVDDGNTVALP